MRSCAFPFNKPGQKMLLTAPELNHLRPIADAIEQQLLSTRLLREMLPETKGNGSGRLGGSCRSTSRGTALRLPPPWVKSRGVVFDEEA